MRASPKLPGEIRNHPSCELFKNFKLWFYNEEKRPKEEILEEIREYEGELSQTLEELSDVYEMPKRELSDLKETLHFNLACCYQNVGDFAKAEEHYQTSLQLKIARDAHRIDIIDVVHALSLLYEESGRSENAMEVYHQHLTDEELISDSALRLGCLHLKSGELERGVRET